MATLSEAKIMHWRKGKDRLQAWLPPTQIPNTPFFMHNFSAFKEFIGVSMAIFYAFFDIFAYQLGIAK